MTCARRESLLHPLYPDYEAFVEGRVRVAGLERDDLFAGERIGDPDILGTDDEVLVGAVVVGSPQGIAEGDEVTLLEVLKVAEDVWGTARVVVRRVADDVRVRVSLVRKAGLGEVHDPLAVQIGLIGRVSDRHVDELQPRHRE